MINIIKILYYVPLETYMFIYLAWKGRDKTVLTSDMDNIIIAKLLALLRI